MDKFLDSDRSMGKSVPGSSISPSPALVLGDECFVEWDFSKCVMGRVKDINSIPNIRIILADEGFEEVKFFYLGGKWMLFEFAMIESKEKLINHTGINSWFHVIQDVFHDFVSDERIIWMDIKVKGKVFMVRVKVLFTWNPVFLSPDEKAYSSDDESVCGVKEKEVRSQSNKEEEGEFVARDVEEVADTNFENGSGVGEVAVNNFDNGTDMLKQHKEVTTTYSEDPFGLSKVGVIRTVTKTSGSSPSLTHPPGFSPPGSATVNQNVQDLREVANNIVEEDSPLISANVMHTSQHIQDDYSGNSAGIGLGNKAKKDWIKELTFKHKINFIAIQETKMEWVSQMDIKYMWGNSNFDYACCDSLGASGGILCIWEESVFKKDNDIISDNFVAIYGTWIPNKSKILLAAIYAPQQPLYRRFLWEYLSILLSRWSGEAIFMGDFNEVRSSDERCGSWFNTANARIFNNFISSSSQVDVNMEGYSFTWSHPSASKMSKLDRFLVTDGIVSLFPSITAVCLDRHLSDHRPILLCEVNLDFGPTPFRFYHSWFNNDGFDAMVEQTWRSVSLTNSNQMIRFKKKLQILKQFIRGWIKDKRSKSSSSRRLIEEELCNIDKQLEKDRATDQILDHRHDLVCQLKDIDHMIASDSIQKSKVSWAIEGDENSKYFHGIINKKRSHLAVRGVFEEGGWITDPTLVKKAFRVHFKSRFQKPSTSGLKLNFEFPNRLSSVLATNLERDVSHDEIKSAVWDCGENKSPGPNGFTFEFVRKYWKCIGPDFCGAVDHFFDNGSFAKGCNSSFIYLIPKVADAMFVNDYRPISLIGSVYKVVSKILVNRLSLVIEGIVSNTQSAFVADRKILDGPFILNEVLQWCKKMHKKGLFLKVDFAKAYDSVRWDFLIDVLEAFGFGSKWCKWIRGTFCFAKALILVNVSHSDKAINDRMFKGIRLNDDISLSHLLYADDALFVGEWSDAKMRVEAMADSIGCSILESKFRYLGVMVGEGMSRHEAWEDVVANLRKRLSKWKAKTLSIGGRLGDGFKSMFWIDRWKGDKYFRDVFPRLFALELNKQVSVIEKLSFDLVVSFRRVVRKGAEKQQVSDLSSLIASVLLAPIPDRWVFSLASDGSFRVDDVWNAIDDLTLPSS
uniref:RNA-directed DNA polymerase, eukaryota n=1 Tax=Tanacetum cinerariifolium TaxID=118510 RepID=A0A6L2J0L2_TANCI|nr:RNA-directed DNA polymerase, eukaryota [Tanacetum cinerariifolium]